MEQTAREKIFEEIERERAYQDEKWGAEFDFKNTANDWAAYINLYVGERVTKMGLTKEQQRAGLVKVAALAVAAMETFDKSGGFALRHYDRG